MTSTAEGLAILADDSLFTVAGQRAYAHELAVWLRDHGHPQARYDVTTGTLELDPTSPAMMSTWALRPRSARTVTLAVSADDAARSADVLDRQWSGFIQKRRERDVSHSYVVLPLHVFAELVATGTAHTAQGSA